MRCRKAHWFLSARCDDTLSEKHRRELAAHLEECPACRREAFYFSEIKGQAGKLDRVRARADFHLRVNARIRAWEAEQEQVKTTRSALWATVVMRLVGARRRLVEAAFAVFGQRRLAVVTVAMATLALTLWTGYRVTVGPQEDSFDYTRQIAQQTMTPGTEGFSFGGVAEPSAQGYLVSAISLSDDMSPRAQPNYVMPTIPAEIVTAREVF